MKFREYVKLNEDHFKIGQKVITPEGKGVVEKIEGEGEKEEYYVKLDIGTVKEYSPSELKPQKSTVEKKPQE